MSSTLYGDAARSNLPASVACVERARSQTPPGPALRAAWDDLVKVLALGPSPVAVGNSTLLHNGTSRRSPSPPATRS